MGVEKNQQLSLNQQSKLTDTPHEYRWILEKVTMIVTCHYSALFIPPILKEEGYYNIVATETGRRRHP